MGLLISIYQDMELFLLSAIRMKKGIIKCFPIISHKLVSILSDLGNNLELVRRPVYLSLLWCALVVPAEEGAGGPAPHLLLSKAHPAPFIP